MEKQVLSIFGALIVYYCTFSLLNRQEIQPSEIIVDIETKVLENDIFYVYYLQEGIKKWSDMQSVHQRIKGNKSYQNLRFSLPLDKPIKRIRIDIGANKNQKPIVINSITIRSEVGILKFEKDFFENFDLNAYATFNKDKFIPKIVNGRYDPFLVSKPFLAQQIESLRNHTKQFSYKFILFISFIFSIAFYIYLINQNFKISISQIYISLFIGIIIAPFVYNTFFESGENGNLEKRELAQMPELVSFEKFPMEFENYYNDNFGLRSVLIDLSGKIKVNIFNSSPKPEKVQFGNDGFLFFNDLNDEIFESYTNSSLLSVEELDRVYEKFESRKEKLAKDGIQYVCGFWPNKHTIYPELLPTSMKLQIEGETSQADQVVSFLKKMDFPFFDVRDALLNAKATQTLYRKLDTHWNSNGAYVAYKSFCESTYDILGLSALDISNFNIVSLEMKEGDLTGQLGVKSIFGFEENLPIYKLEDKSRSYTIKNSNGLPRGTIVTQNQNAPKKEKVLIFRDSFTSALVQFISLNYSEVVYVNGIYDQDIIDSVKPDVVISCRVERYILSM
ncbi:alginate O-acetyltransferase AlgX-related protein [Flagellimonas abyssi]|uniref:AlgX/AlgJ SGNH hydrolase-like domain-containing protein n=1 Tax=Flagellimonas abyssi TaxID=2864871 RepID=A0ABS7EN13_9FLAO|nr:hypothetical protein [Allomuricauda abyssi]MBW8198974.1 hypothetical protein [Allomuricauda abyssi]